MKEIDDTQNICSYCHKDNKEYIADVHVLPAGTVLNEKYLVGAVQGEGGFGITYIGKNILFDITIAIKEFYPTGMVTRNCTQAYTVVSITDEKAKKLFSESKDIFWNEAKTLAGFNSEPGIVSVLDFFTANNTAYIVTEFLDGETLEKYLERLGKLSFDNTLCLLMPVMESLIKIHKKNLIHRDISPDNIMLVGESVKLIDFGATRQFADNTSLSVILKEGYAPAEQYSSKGNQGTWTDVYALCAVIYRCITGVVPMSSPERISLGEEIVPPSELGINISPAIENVLMKGLALRYKDRIQTVEELIDEFTKVMNSKAEETQSTEPKNNCLPNNNADKRLSELIDTPIAFPVSDDETGIKDNQPEPETNSLQVNDNADTNKRLTALIDTPRDHALSDEEDSEHTAEPFTDSEPENTPEEVSKVKYLVAAIVSVLLIGGGIFGLSRLNSGGSLQTDYSEVTETAATTATTTTAVFVTESSSLSTSSSTTTTTAIPSETKTSSETTIASVTKKTKAKTTTAKSDPVSKTSTTTKASTTTTSVTTTVQTTSKTETTTVTQVVVMPTDIILSETNIELEVGESNTVSATVTPSNAANKNVSWSSSNSGVATVENGVITAKKAGTATITAKTENGITAVCQVKVNDVTVKSLSLNEESISMEEGDTVDLVAAVLPEDAANKTVTWKSSNSNIATVSNGTVKAKSKGTATITATTVNGISASCSVTVNEVMPISVSLDKTSCSLNEGESEQLKATISPNNAKDKSIVWSSSNSGVVYVSNGNVTAISKGTATITATTINGISASCSFTVNEIVPGYVTLDRSSCSLYDGEEMQLTATVFPENAKNKTISWMSSDTSVATIANGTVKAIKAGSASITATTVNGKSITCYVTVNLYKGDVNYDNRLDMDDIDLINQYVKGAASLSSDQLKRADVNNDGAVDMSDIFLLNKMRLNKV